MKDLCQKWKVELIFRGAYWLPETGIVECLEIIDVGCNLKVWWLDLSDSDPQILRQISATVVNHYTTVSWQWASRRSAKYIFWCTLYLLSVSVLHKVEFLAQELKPYLIMSSCVMSTCLLNEYEWKNGIYLRVWECNSACWLTALISAFACIAGYAAEGIWAFLFYYFRLLKHPSIGSCDVDLMAKKTVQTMRLHWHSFYIGSVDVLRFLFTRKNVHCRPYAFYLSRRECMTAEVFYFSISRIWLE